MSHFEDLSGEILMAIFEYMDIEDIWTIFFNMNSRLNALVFDTRLHLTADMSNIEKYNFQQLCPLLSTINISNIHTLILSNNYYRYPQIRLFLSQTNFSSFYSLYSLTLIDINYDELMEIIKQIKDLDNLKHLHINTHEIFYDGQLENVTIAMFNQPNIRVLGLRFHEAIQWHDKESIPLSNLEVLSLDFLPACHVFTLLFRCPYLRSLSITLDTRTSASIPDPDEISFYSQITKLCLYLRPFNASLLNRLLTCLPSIKYFSIGTLIDKVNYLRAPYWTLLLQQHLPLLERLQLNVRGYDLFNNKSLLNEYQQNIIDGYRYDRYWLDRTEKKIFICRTYDTFTVLQIR